MEAACLLQDDAIKHNCALCGTHAGGGESVGLSPPAIELAQLVLGLFQNALPVRVQSYCWSPWLTSYRMRVGLIAVPFLIICFEFI